MKSAARFEELQDPEVINDNGKNPDTSDKNDAQALQTAVDKIALAVDQGSQNGQLEKMLTNLALQLDQSKTFQTFQDFWNALPEKVQLVLLKAENYIPFLTIEYLNNLVQMGLLEFKGHEDPETQIDQDAETVAGNKRQAIELVAKANPEAKAAVPILQSLARLDEKKRAMFRKIRRTLTENRPKEGAIEQTSQSRMAA